MLYKFVLNIWSGIPAEKRKLGMVVVGYSTLIVLMAMLLRQADRFMSKLDSYPYLLVFVLGIVLLGIVNVIILKTGSFVEFPIWLKTAMSATAGGICAAIFFIFKLRYELSELGILFLQAHVLFVLPWFFIIAIKAIVDIPKLEYAPIKIRGLKDVVAELDFGEDESRGIIWEFVDLDELAGDYYYWVRTHTPHKVNDIPLKHLFKCLLSLHNFNLKPAKPIDFEHEGSSFGWLFYSETKTWFGQTRKPLDPDKTLFENGVRFKKITKKERKTLTNLRRDLSKNFKSIKIQIHRIKEMQSEVGNTENVIKLDKQKRKHAFNS